MSDKKKRYMLPEEEIPHYWYNIQADMVNKPMPPLHPGTKQPLKAEDLYPIFAEELCRQELVPMVWKKHWVRRHISISRMKVSARWVHTN